MKTVVEGKSFHSSLHPLSVFIDISFLFLLFSKNITIGKPTLFRESFIDQWQYNLFGRVGQPTFNDGDWIVESTARGIQIERRQFNRIVKSSEDVNCFQRQVDIQMQRLRTIECSLVDRKQSLHIVVVCCKKERRHEQSRKLLETVYMHVCARDCSRNCTCVVQKLLLTRLKLKVILKKYLIHIILLNILY